MAKRESTSKESASGENTNPGRRTLSDGRKSAENYGEDGPKVKDLINLLLRWKYDPNNIGLDPMDIIENNLYPAEKYTVETSDQYLLTLHRIPYGLANNDFVRPVVLLTPGLGCSSACFLDKGPEHSLGFILADSGYDVWLMNSRGTTFSRRHVTYDPDKDKKFWDFSWHEIGILDLTAVIDYILLQTNSERLSIIGHSMGTTMSFVMASEKLEYNDKLNAIIALAPVAFLKNVEHPFLVLMSKHWASIYAAFRMAGVLEVLPHTNEVSLLVNKTCQTSVGCIKLVTDLTTDYDPVMMDLNDVTRIAMHYPAGMSVKTLVHFAQSIKTGAFQQFDHGKVGNRKNYHQPTPPDYNLRNITTPVYLVYGEADILATPKDVKKLFSKLPSAKIHKVDYKRWNHEDFLWGIEVKSLVYQYVLKMLKVVNKK